MRTIDRTDEVDVAQGRAAIQSAQRPADATIFDLVAESVIVIDLNGRIVGWNKASETLYGWHVAQVCGRLYEEVMHDSAWFDASNEWRSEEATLISTERQRRTAGGEEIVVASRLVARRDAVGAHLDWLEFGTDMTAQRRAEKAEESAQQRYHNVFQAIPAAVCAIDFSEAREMALGWLEEAQADPWQWFTAHPDHVRQLMRATYCLDVNDFTTELFAPRQKSDMLVSIDHYWPDSTIPDYIDWIVSALAGETQFSREIRQRRYDGVEFDSFFTSRFAPGTIEQGRFIVTVIDYTDIKRSQVAIRQSEAFYTDMFHGTAFSAWRLDASQAHAIFTDLHAAGVTDFRAELDQDPTLLPRLMESIKVVDVNEATVSLFEGADREEILGTAITPYWHPDGLAPLIGSLEASFNNVEAYRSLARMRTLTGRNVDVLYTRSSSGALQSAGEILLAIVDISDKVQAERALAEMQTTLAHAARVSSLGELTASIAHEVNQPLTAISANGDATLSWLSRPSPDLEKCRSLIEEMIADASRASQVVSHIRSMASPQVGLLRLLSLNALARETLGLLADQLARRNVAANIDFKIGLPAVMGDAVQLQQVVVNLVLNAVQAMTDQSCARLMLRTSFEADHVILTVEDNGPGIPPENLEKLFESFFTTKPDGMGIGLKICCTFVEAHGGVISASNLAKGGARFIVRLPKAEGG